MSDKKKENEPTAILDKKAEAIETKAAPLSMELTEEEMLQLEEEAKLEAAAEIRAQKKKAFKEAAIKKHKTTALFSAGKDDKGADLETITLNLSPAQPYISLDGVLYYNGKTYTKSVGVIQTLKDIAGRGWKEEDIRLGENSNVYNGRRSMESRGAVLGSSGVRYTA